LNVSRWPLAQQRQGDRQAGEDNGDGRRPGRPHDDGVRPANGGVLLGRLLEVRVFGDLLKAEAGQSEQPRRPDHRRDRHANSLAHKGSLRVHARVQRTADDIDQQRQPAKRRRRREGVGHH
jgi:hypothetical protein